MYYFFIYIDTTIISIYYRYIKYNLSYRYMYIPKELEWEWKWWRECDCQWMAFFCGAVVGTLKCRTNVLNCVNWHYLLFLPHCAASLFLSAITPPPWYFFCPALNWWEFAWLTDIKRRLRRLLAWLRLATNWNYLT